MTIIILNWRTGIGKCGVFCLPFYAPCRLRVPAGQPMLDAVDFLRRIERQRHPDLQQAPLEVVPSAWRRLVKPPRASVVDRQAYTLCAVERPGSIRGGGTSLSRGVNAWGDPRLKLLQGEQWARCGPRSAVRWAGVNPLRRSSTPSANSLMRPIDVPRPICHA